jgi:DNA modification methylase
MTEINQFCADALAWMKAQPSAIYDLIIADPPYNVGKDYGNASDTAGREEHIAFLGEWAQEASRLLAPNGTLYSFMGFRHISHLFNILEDACGLRFNSWICWHYTQGLGKKRGFSARHDDILMFTKSNQFTFNLDDVRVPQKYYRSVNNMRGANPGDVWAFSHVHYCQENRQKHPTQKPEGLIERMVRASSNPGDRVLDPFSGSGTTLRVCQQLGRSCDGVEINPEYVADAEKRLQNSFTGFDSIDPRMKRVPQDLRDQAIRDRYVRDHIDMTATSRAFYGACPKPIPITR